MPQPRSSAHGFRRSTGALLAVVAAVVISTVVACVPESQDTQTRTASQLALRAAADRVPTTQPRTAPPTSATATTAPTTAPSPPPPTGSYVIPGTRPGVAGCAIFPRDHVFHATITALPTRPDSASTIAAAGPSTPIMAGFGSGVWQGSRLGYPINELDARTAPTKDLLVGLDNIATSNATGVPWPDAPRFEGWPGRAWDKHLLVVDSSSCRSWEAINVQPPYENVFGAVLNRWYADKVVAIDLSTNVPRSGGTVTASGFSMLSGLIRYDEVASGRIDHVLSMTYPTIRSGGYTWPARGSDGTSANLDAPPMGAWFRLKADADTSRLGPQAQVVARAMRDHGVVLVDSSSNAALSGEPDLRWNDADLNTIRGLTMADLEVVDPSAMKVSDSSFQIR